MDKTDIIKRMHRDRHAQSQQNKKDKLEYQGKSTPNPLTVLPKFFNNIEVKVNINNIKYRT